MYIVRGQLVTQLWERIPVLEHAYLSFEKNYDAENILQWMKGKWEVPIAAVLAYAFMVFFVPSILKHFKVKPMGLRNEMAIWNAFLSVFSFIGMVRTVPHLLYNIATMEYADTVCAEPYTNWGSGATGLWVQLFILSKIPELVDTLWLVLKQREVIFLHWYHHITVLLYCWHAYTNEAGAGLYFVAMNYSVHAVMYGYYCLQSLKFIPKWFPAYLITIAQIAQMFVGTGVCISCWYFMLSGRQCSNTFENLVAGALMYGSYLYLFVAFALDRFVFNSGKNKQLKKEA